VYHPHNAANTNTNTTVRRPIADSDNGRRREFRR
jgi:hypothetical protein